MKSFWKVQFTFIFLFFMIIVSGCQMTYTSYTITFNSNGGSAITAITLVSNTVINPPTNPTKQGYTFIDWYTNNDLTNSYSFTKMPAENITLYAKWAVNSYTLTFNSNGGTVVSSITQNYETAVTKPADPTKSGYNFAGWFSNNILTSAYTFSSMPALNLTLYAKWALTDYTSNDLFISEYFESSANNKYIEIYNNTGQEVNLSQYQIANYANGSTTGVAVDLSGVLENGHTLIIYNNQATNQAIVNSGGIASSIISFDGDDAVALQKNGIVIDVFGIIGTRPPSGGYTVDGVDNASVDNTIIRNYGVFNPTATFNPEQWTVLGLDDTSNLGIHNMIGITPVEDPNDPVVVDKTTLVVNTDESMQDAVNDMYQYYGESDTTYLLPSTGNVNLLVIPIQFPDDYFTNSELNTIDYGFFGNGTSFETLKSYYYKSSYGALTFSGNVLTPYTASHGYDYYDRYSSTHNQDASGVDLLIEEAITYYLNAFPNLDLSIYDTDGDGFLDAVHIVYSAPVDYNSDTSIYWAYQYYYNATKGTDDNDYVSWGNYEFDSYVFSGVDFFTEDGIQNAWTIIHETGHLMGLEDYYDYTPGRTDPNRGGLGSADMMDDTRGDHNPFSKLLLNWVDPIVVTNSCTITINQFESSGDSIIVSNQFNSIFDEYFIMDFYTHTGLNIEDDYLTQSGLLMYHVDAELPTNYDNLPDYSYYLQNNNSDSSRKLIKIEEADGNNSISSHDDYTATNSDLLQTGETYVLKLYNNTTVCTVTVLEITADTMTLSFEF